MLDRIKAFAETVKGVLLYIVTPLAFLAGYIYMLLRKEKALEDKIDFMTKDEKQKQFEVQVKEDEKDVQQASSDYDSIRAQYLAQSGKSGGELPADNPGGGPGDSGKGQADQGS